MRRPSVPALLGVLAASATLAAAPGARADSPLNEYQQTGHITPCKYSSGQLQGGVPNDVAQYAPEYLSQLQAAARDRARGCGGGASGGSGSGTLSGGGGASGGGSGGGAAGGSSGLAKAPAPPKIQAPAAAKVPPLSIRQVAPAASGTSTTPGPILALAVLAAVGLLGLALVVTGRLLGWHLGWTAPARHALREGGMRAGAAVSGVADWARGRRGASGA